MKSRELVILANAVQEYGSKNNSLSLKLDRTLVNMYTKYGTSSFLSPCKYIFIWGALIAECTHKGQAKQVLDCFGKVWASLQTPCTLTLEAWDLIGEIDKGKQSHGKVRDYG